MNDYFLYKQSKAQKLIDESEIKFIELTNKIDNPATDELEKVALRRDAFKAYRAIKTSRKRLIALNKDKLNPFVARLPLPESKIGGNI